jgi:hypothetical protein
MIKKLIACAILGVLLGLGWVAFSAYRNTPERMAGTFVNDLSAGKTDQAYERLTSRLTREREQYWKDYLAQFKTEHTLPERLKDQTLTDRFNTYTEANSPERFVYKVIAHGKPYQLTMIVIKQGKTWNVDELYGSSL